MIKIGQILNRWGPSIRVVPYNIKSNLYETITVAIDEILCLKNWRYISEKNEKPSWTFKAGPRLLLNNLKHQIYSLMNMRQLHINLFNSAKT